MSVALLLVTHDGARWLPSVLEGIAGQTVAIDRIVCVDTGSKDGSVALVEAVFGDEGALPHRAFTVLRMSSSTSYPRAVDAAMEVLRDDAVASDWIWLLHDDSNPEPGALAALLAAAERRPGADVLGPTLREWPSLRRLLEVGVTISGTGRRETGLEHGEYDQGQYGTVRQVLAVNTAGMLVRRGLVLKLHGFDPHLPIFGNDIDFGWRAASAGHETVIVPTAVVFHAEAAHQGLRRTALTGRHVHYQERRASLYTLLVNSKARTLWFQLPRHALWTLVRMIGFLSVRQVGAALDDLAALVSVYSSPRELLRARRERHGRQTVSSSDLKGLLPPWWLPYRHGLDFLADFFAAVTLQAADLAERRRISQAEADPASFAARRQELIVDRNVGIAASDDDDLPPENGWVARFFSNPTAVLLAVAVVIGLVATRSGFGTIAAAGLSPAPDHVSTWWRLITESWHSLGLGSAVPASPSILFLAVLGSVLGGHAGLALSCVMVAAFPLSLWGAWRLTRVVGRLVSHRGAPRWLILWVAASYAFIPIVSGAWGDGRLDVVAVTALLPLFAHAALGFAEPEADRRTRAGWRAGFLLTVIVSFTPVAWLVALAFGVVVFALGLVVAPRAMTKFSAFKPPLTALLIPVVLLAVWWLPAVIHGAGGLLFLDSGRLPSPVISGHGLALGRLHGLGAPWWLGLGAPVLAVVALVPRRTRIPVLVCWIIAVTAGVVAWALSLFQLDLPSGTSPLGTGAVLVLVQGTLLLAGALGVQGAIADGFAVQRGAGAITVAQTSRRWLVALVGLVALAGPVGAAVWAVDDGAGAWTKPPVSNVPSYMQEVSARQMDSGVLVLSGTATHGLSYTLVRGEGTTLGEDQILALTKPDAEFDDTVRSFVSLPTQSMAARLAGYGIRYVVMAPPADADVAAQIDAGSGVEQASATEAGMRAWQVDAPVTAAELHAHSSWLHRVLVVVWLLGLVVVAVQAAPTWIRRRL